MLIAVYGTLRDGCGNDHYMKKEGVTFLGNAETKPEFTMLSAGGFPIVKTEGDTKIQLEVYRVENENALAGIFRLEHYTGRRDDPNNWYNTTNVETPYGTAEMFVQAPEKCRGSLPVITSGDWLKR